MCKIWPSESCFCLLLVQSALYKPHTCRHPSDLIGLRTPTSWHQSDHHLHQLYLFVSCFFFCLILTSHDGTSSHLSGLQQSAANIELMGDITSSQLVTTVWNVHSKPSYSCSNSDIQLSEANEKVSKLDWVTHTALTAEHGLYSMSTGNSPSNPAPEAPHASTPSRPRQETLSTPPRIQLYQLHPWRLAQNKWL